MPTWEGDFELFSLLLVATHMVQSADGIITYSYTIVLNARADDV